MLPLNLPSYPVKIQVRNGKNVIFDPLRRKFVALTPEEWVRQHFVNLLTEIKGYPKGLIGNEVQLDLNGTKKRCGGENMNNFHSYKFSLLRTKTVNLL